MRADHLKAKQMIWYPSPSAPCNLGEEAEGRQAGRRDDSGIRAAGRRSKLGWVLKPYQF